MKICPKCNGINFKFQRIESDERDFQRKKTQILESIGCPSSYSVLAKNYDEYQRINFLKEACTKLKETTLKQLENLPAPKKKNSSLLVSMGLQKQKLDLNEIHELTESHNLFVLDMVSQNFTHLDIGSINLLQTFDLFFYPSDKFPYYQFYKPAGYQYKRKYFAGDNDVYSY